MKISYKNSAQKYMSATNLMNHIYAYKHMDDTEKFLV